MGDNVCGRSWKECLCLRIGVVTDCKGGLLIVIILWGCQEAAKIGPW